METLQSPGTRQSKPRFRNSPVSGYQIDLTQALKLSRLRILVEQIQVQKLSSLQVLCRENLVLETLSQTQGIRSSKSRFRTSPVSGYQVEKTQVQKLSSLWVIVRAYLGLETLQSLGLDRANLGLETIQSPDTWRENLGLDTLKSPGRIQSNLGLETLPSPSTMQSTEYRFTEPRRPRVVLKSHFLTDMSRGKEGWGNLVMMIVGGNGYGWGMFNLGSGGGLSLIHI